MEEAPLDLSMQMLAIIDIKDYPYHDFPNTEFSYFLTIDTKQ